MVDRTYPRTPITKVCTTCSLPKILEDFPYQKAGKFGRHATCKECKRKDTNNRYTYETQREKSLRRFYGISLSDYILLKEEQESKCAVCGQYTEDLHVDHNHTTGKVRGLLCHGCNTGIGMLGDTIEALEKALEYLRNSDRVDDGVSLES